MRVRIVFFPGPIFRLIFRVRVEGGGADKHCSAFKGEATLGGFLN